MAKIMLLDFEESDYRRLLDRKLDVELKQTNWRSSGRARPAAGGCNKRGRVPGMESRRVVVQVPG